MPYFVTPEASRMAEPKFTAEIGTSKATYKSGEDVEFNFKLTSESTDDFQVLKWHTPLEGIRNNFLDVQRDGQKVRYRGMMMKRGNPSAKSYILVPAGSSVEASVKLNEGYDVSEPGTYRVELNTRLMDVKMKCEGEDFQPSTLMDGFNHIELSAEPITFDVER